MAKDIFTTGELTKFCGASNKTILKWIKQGLLKAFQLPGGDHYRVKKDDLIIFLNENAIPLPQEFQVVDEGKKKILIIDDERNMVASICRILELDGRFDIDVAYDGFEGGLKLNVFKPHLVLLDVQMDGITGYGVLKAIRSNDATIDMKVIIISGRVTKDEGENFIELGADMFIAKPFGNEDLITEISSLLEMEYEYA